MENLTLRGYVTTRTAIDSMSERDRLEGDRGEGVISVAIAVLVMAALGAAMWIAFKGIFDDTAQKTQDQINNIG